MAPDSLIAAIVTYLLPVVGAIHVGLGIYAFRFRKVPAAFPFGIAMFLASIWAFALAMELVSSSLADKIFWSNLRIPATSMLAVTWLIMSIRHARLSWLNSRRIVALSIVPAITTTLLWTGVYSALYRYNFRLDVSGSFPTLIADTGPWYWVGGALYGQVMIWASVILLVRSLRGAPSLYRRQTGMIIVAGLVPVVVELVSQSVPRLRGGSFTPVVFAFTGVLVAWGLFRYRMFGVVPVARDLVLENMTGLVFVVDGNGRVVDLNPAAQRAVGLEPYNVIGHTAEGVLRDWTGLPIDLGATEFAMGEMDKRRVYDMSVSPINNNEGDVVGRLLLLHDITERKRMEEELRRHTEHLEELVEERTRGLSESEKRFRELAELLPGIVFETSANGNFTFMNRSGFSLTGYSVEDLNGGLNWLQLYAPQERDAADEHLRSTLTGDILRAHEHIVMRKDGSTFPAIVHSAPIMQEGRPLGVRGIAIDISERKRTELELAKSRRLAAIGEAAAIIGHDLRNPLQGISTATHLLKKKLESTPDEGTKRMLSTIEKGVERSESIIRGLLDYSREINLEVSEHDSKSLTVEALSLVKVPADIKILNLTQNQLKIKVDGQKITRVFVNIIQNAIEAMPEGGTLTVSTRQSNGNLETTFSDTGVGMTKEVMRQIWTPLFTTKSRGIGLGLPASRRIVEAHQGSISVETTPGKGSTFIVRLPSVLKPEV